MNENAMIDVPIRWVLGDPEVTDHTTQFDGTDWFLGWESPDGNFTDETVQSFIDEYNYNPDDIRVQVYRYHEWLEVIVLQSIACGRDLMAYTCIERTEISAGTLRALEPDLANLIVRFAYIENLSM